MIRIYTDFYIWVFLPINLFILLCYFAVLILTEFFSLVMSKYTC